MEAEFVRALLSPAAMALFGLCIGSFLNVVVHRLPKMMHAEWCEECAEILNVPAPPPPAEPLSLSSPPSRCPQCAHRIRWYENIPLASWLWLRGKCSACKTPISIRYPAIELLTGALFAAVAWRFGSQPVLLAWCAFAAVLVALAAIDWDTTLLPDVMVYPLLWGGLVAAALGWTLPLTQALWGAVAGYMSLWVLDRLYRLIRRSRFGMASGDMKLLAALGAWLGWQMLLPLVLVASVIGVAAAVLMHLRKSLGQIDGAPMIPFGPFLAGGALVVMFAGQARVKDWMGWV